MKKYSSYIDSGVQWLGEIPEHWKLKPGYTILYEVKEKNKGMKRNTVLSLSYGKIKIKEAEDLNGLVPESFETYQLVNKGDLIFRPTDLQNDQVSLRSAMSDYEGIITSAYLNFRLLPNTDSRYYSYLFRNIDNNKVIYGLGSGLRQNISFLDFKRFIFPYPPLPEQTRIAQFLDKKTALIDKAIALKEKQIELLKERRQIVIHRAVTRGIGSLSGAETPDVKLKDSGVEWIGEIPEHWEVQPIKYSLNGIVDCEHSTAPFVDEEKYFVVRTSNVKGGKLVYEDAKYTTEKGFEHWTRRGIPREGDILLTREAPAGEACLVPHNVKICLGQRMVWLKINREKLIPQFGIYQIYSILVRTYIDLLSAGSTVLHFNMSDISNIPIISMPLPEQTQIVYFLEQIDFKISTAITLKEKEIEKLKEYKSVLINEAVSGKIKVG